MIPYDRRQNIITQEHNHNRSSLGDNEVKPHCLYVKHLRFKRHSKLSATNFEVSLGHFSPTKIPNFVDGRPEIQTPEKLDPLSNENRASLVAQLVKNPPAMWETWVRPLGWEDILETGKATHSSILAWRIPWTEFHGVAKSSQTRLSDFH